MRVFWGSDIRMCCNDLGYGSTTRTEPYIHVSQYTVQLSVFDFNKPGSSCGAQIYRLLVHQMIICRLSIVLLEKHGCQHCTVLTTRGGNAQGSCNQASCKHSVRHPCLIPYHYRFEDPSEGEKREETCGVVHKELRLCMAVFVRAVCLSFNP